MYRLCDLRWLKWLIFLHLDTIYHTYKQISSLFLSSSLFSHLVFLRFLLSLLLHSRFFSHHPRSAVPSLPTPLFLFLFLLCLLVTHVNGLVVSLYTWQNGKTYQDKIQRERERHRRRRFRIRKKSLWNVSKLDGFGLFGYFSPDFFWARPH